MKTFLKNYRFESKEMKDSYVEFQKGNERILISFFNLIFVPILLIMLLISLFNQVPLAQTMIRGSLTLVGIIAYFLKIRGPKIQKILLFGITAISIYMVIYNIEIIWTSNHVRGGFIVGNTLGLLETCFVLSFKNVGLKSLVFITFCIVKGVALRDEIISNTWKSGFSILFILLTLIFYLSDYILDRKIFKIIYESRDKLKKFQELLSNDLPSSVVIVSSISQEIIYSNKFFQANIQVNDCLDKIKMNSTNNIQVFKKFVIDENTNKESKLDKSTSLYDFLRKMETDPYYQLTETQVLTLSAIYKDIEDTELYYEIKLRKITWESIPSYAMVLNNVTDKQMVIALKLADQQKDKVIATVSHELRTPINGILGLIEMVTKRTGDALSLEYLDYAKSCSKLLLYLVNSILDLSQIRHNSFKVNKDLFNLHKFLEEVRSLYIFHSQQKDIEFIVQIDPEVPKDIFTDKYRLIEILINLLGNAMKFTFKGSISLRISVDQDDPQKLKFCVEDTGIGIKDTDKPKLFQMFGKVEQAKKGINTQGVGLGLTIANELVRILNNRTRGKEERIEFESEFGKGSRFWFRVNVYPQALQLSQDSFLSPLEVDLSNEEQDPAFFKEYSHDSDEKLDKKMALHPTSPKCRIMSYNKSATSSQINLITSQKNILSNRPELVRNILIVDDSPFNLIAASFILEQFGYLTQKAFNGKECIEILEKNEKHYCMILTDIQMPVLDGLEMSRIINQKIKKKEIYNVPIVAVTALKLSDVEQKKYQEYGIEYVLEKPLVSEKVQLVLSKLALFE